MLIISRPFGRVLFLAAVFLVSGWGIVEIILRVLQSSHMLPDNGYGTCFAEFDLKISLLDSFVKEEGFPDCIFLGNSMVDLGIDPQQFSFRYQDLTQRPIRCFNFGLLTLSTSPAGRLGHLLVDRYQPKLLIYGITPRDLMDSRGEVSRPLLHDPWINQMAGYANVEGWVIENSLAYRGLISIRQQTKLPYIEELAYFQENPLSRLGYLKQDRPNDTETGKVLLSGYEASERDLLGLKEISQQANTKTQVIIMEMPVYPPFLEFYLEGGTSAYERLFIQPISTILTNQNTTFLRTQPSIEKVVCADCWQSNLHLNGEGAAQFSVWLADMLAGSSSASYIYTNN